MICGFFAEIEDLLEICEAMGKRNLFSWFVASIWRAVFLVVLLCFVCDVCLFVLCPVAVDRFCCCVGRRTTFGERLLCSE